MRQNKFQIVLVMIKQLSILAICSLILFSCDGKKSKTNDSVKSDNFDTFLFIGTYTAKESKGIHLYKFNTETGESQFVHETPIANPSYLAISDDQQHVYAVSESGDKSSLTTFAFDKVNESLTPESTVETAADPCYVAVNNQLNVVAVAEYSGGSVAFFNLRDSLGNPTLELSQRTKFEGKGVDPSRQKQPHLHQVLFTPNNKLLANDLGTDKIYEFSISSTEGSNYSAFTKSNEFEVKAGSGPRHTVFHPSINTAYTITELSGEVIVFDYNVNTGALTEKQRVIADTLQVKGSGDIQITPDGKYLYASNRLKGDGVAIFKVDMTNGELHKIGYQPTGIHPRNLVITPNGKLLLVATRDSNKVQVFKIENNGLLRDLNHDIELSMPVCLKFASIK